MAITDQINSIIANQQTYAASAVAQALSAASRAQGGYIPYAIEANLSFTNSTPIPGAVAPPPVFSAVYNAPTNNASLTDLESLYIPTIPTFSSAPATLDTSSLFSQATPVFDVSPFSETAPTVDTELDIPAAPDLNIPATPVISEVNIPNAPDITIPDFVPVDTDATDPGEIGDVLALTRSTYDNAVPQMRAFLDDVVNGWMSKYAPEYSTAMSQLEAKIAAGMNGGTAMSDVIEQQIYDRARDRTEAEAQRASEDLLEGMSKRGYQLPPSAISAGLNQIQQATAKNLASTAAETAIARAKLEQEHAQFIMNLSSTLHMGLLGTAVQYAQQLVQINGQSLQYSKQLAESLVTEYNARLERYKAELQLAGIQTQIYESQLKAALADITIFEAEIRAAELSKNIEKIDVDVYSALIKAESTKIDNYVAELQGVSTAANLEKLKVEIYGEQVRAYVAQVGAKKAEFDVYTAAIGGDEAKVRAYSTQVQAYAQEVNAAKSIADVEIAHSRAISDHNKNIIDEYRAELSAYGAELDAAKTTFGADSEAYRARIEAYKAYQAITLDTFNAKYKHSALDLDAAKASLSATLQSEIGIREIAQRGIASGGSTAVGVANAMAGLASSAASATNTITTAALESTG